MDQLKAALLSTEEGTERYDRTLKQLFTNKRVLATIMKRFIPEYKDCTIEDIRDIYIEPKVPDASTVYVQTNLSNIQGLANEDKSNSEGNVTYDIRFEAAYPGGGEELIGLIINLELQGEIHKDYPIEKRAVYYAARNLSSQLKSLSKSTCYNSLKKVYSIWIVYDNDMADSKAGTVSLYRMNEHDIIGHTGAAERHYDLISVLMIKIKESVKNEDRCLELIRVLTSGLIGTTDKLRFLRESGFDEDFQKEVEEVGELGFGAALQRKAYDKGRAEGKDLERRDVAFRLFRNGNDFQTVVAATGMPYETIDAWHKEYMEGDVAANK